MGWNGAQKNTFNNLPSNLLLEILEYLGSQTSIPSTLWLFNSLPWKIDENGAFKFMNDKHDDTHWGVYLFKHGAVFQVAPEVFKSRELATFGDCAQGKGETQPKHGGPERSQNKSKHHTHKRKPKNISSNQHAGHHLFRGLWLLIRNPSRPYIYMYVCMYVYIHMCMYIYICV